MPFAVSGPGRTQGHARTHVIEEAPSQNTIQTVHESQHLDFPSGRGDLGGDSVTRSRGNALDGRRAAHANDISMRARLEAMMVAQSHAPPGRGADTGGLVRGVAARPSPTVPSPTVPSPSTPSPSTPSPSTPPGASPVRAPTPTPSPSTGPRVIGPNGDAQPLNPAQLSTPEEAREVLQVLQGLGLQGVGVTEQQLGGPYRYEFGDDPRRVFMIGNMNVGLARDTLRNNPPHIALERLRLDLQHKPITFGGDG